MPTASPGGAASISFVTILSRYREQGREEEGQVALSVTDTGVGISEEQQQSVFEAFRQADGTISRKTG